MGNTNRILEDHSCDYNDSNGLPLRFKPADDASLSRGNSIVSFAPNTNSTVIVPIDCVLKQDKHELCIRLKIHASNNSQVIIGFVRPHSLPYPVFFDSCYVNVSLGRVIIENSRVFHLPICANNGGEIACCIDMHKDIIRYSVTNPDVRTPTIINLSIATAGLPREVEPMVGVLGIGSGNDGVTVAMLSSEQPVSNASSLKGVRFENSSVFGPVEITANGLIAKRKNNDCNCCVAINQAIRTGIHRWTLKVVTDFGSSVCLGLARYPLNISNIYTNTHRQLYLHPDLMMWRSFKGYLYANGQRLNTSLEPIGWNQSAPSVIVEFVLNMNLGELEIIRNGKSMGVAFKDIKGPVCPAVIFYANYEKAVEIIDYQKGDLVSEQQRQNNTNTQHVPSSPPVTTNPIPKPQRTPVVPSVSSPSNIRLSTTRSNSIPNPLQYDSPPPPTPSNPIQLLPVSTCGQARQQPKAVFDSLSKCGELIVSDDGLTLTRTSAMSGNAYCLLNKVCSKGVYRWSFRIERDEGASTCIGITSEPVDELYSPKHIYYSKSMFLCRSYQGTLYSSGTEFMKSFEEFWDDGSRVELTLDLENTVLHYSINGIDQGVAFFGMNGTYRPVVAFYSTMKKKITLLKFEELFTQCRQVNLSDSINNLSTQTDEQTESSATNEMSSDSKVSVAEQSEICVVCSVKDNNVAILPCRHIVYCPVHAETAGTCIVCGVKISGVWNVF